MDGYQKTKSYKQVKKLPVKSRPGVEIMEWDFYFLFYTFPFKWLFPCVYIMFCNKNPQPWGQIRQAPKREKESGRGSLWFFFLIWKFFFLKIILKNKGYKSLFSKESHHFTFKDSSWQTFLVVDIFFWFAQILPRSPKGWGYCILPRSL